MPNFCHMPTQLMQPRKPLHQLWSCLKWKFAMHSLDRLISVPCIWYPPRSKLDESKFLCQPKARYSPDCVFLFILFRNNWYNKSPSHLDVGSSPAVHWYHLLLPTLVYTHQLFLHEMDSLDYFRVIYNQISRKLFYCICTSQRRVNAWARLCDPNRFFTISFEFGLREAAQYK